MTDGQSEACEANGPYHRGSTESVEEFLWRTIDDLRRSANELKQQLQTATNSRDELLKQLEQTDKHNEESFNRVCDDLHRYLGENCELKHKLMKLQQRYDTLRDGGFGDNKVLREAKRNLTHIERCLETPGRYTEEQVRWFKAQRYILKYILEQETNHD